MVRRYISSYGWLVSAPDQPAKRSAVFRVPAAPAAAWGREAAFEGHKRLINNLRQYIRCRNLSNPYYKSEPKVLAARKILREEGEGSTRSLNLHGTG